MTRARSDQPVTRIVWNGPALRARIAETGETDSAIRESVSVDTLSAGPECPAHFFEVEISNVARHAAGLMLNQEAVRAYIGEVCPVPIAPTFPFSSRIETLLKEDAPPLGLELFLDDNPAPVKRRFAETIQFSADRKDSFTDLQEIHVPSVDGNASAAIGWIAHSSYLGAIPREAGIRGVRARSGNIQIGDETHIRAPLPRGTVQPFGASARFTSSTHVSSRTDDAITSNRGHISEILKTSSAPSYVKYQLDAGRHQQRATMNKRFCLHYAKWRKPMILRDPAIYPLEDGESLDQAGC